MFEYPRLKKLLLCTYVEDFEERKEPTTANRLAIRTLPLTAAKYSELYPLKQHKSSIGIQLVYRYTNELSKDRLLIISTDGRMKKYRPTEEAIATVQKFTDEFLRRIEQDLARNIVWQASLESIGEGFKPEVINGFYRILLHYSRERAIRDREFSFTGTTNDEVFKKRILAKNNEFTWMLPRNDILPDLDKNLFSVTNVKISCQGCGLNMNCEERERRIINNTELTYLYSVADVPFHSTHSTKDKRFTISYDVSTLISKIANYFFIEVPWPTKGFTLDFDYTKADVKSVEVKEFLHMDVPCKVERSAGRLKISTDPNYLMDPGRGLTVVWQRG